MELRLARPADAEAIRAIYNHEVEHTTHTFDLEPRTLDQQRAWLAERTGAFAVLVAEIDGRVAGFASLSPYRDRPAYRTTVEDSVYVDRTCRSRGVGRALLSGVVEAAANRGFHSVIGRIVGGHEASIALHHACGFRVVGTEREVGRKFGRWLDVVIMQRLLP
ncbi:MAG: N-acetyltransferase family protein [Actinomyces sp.]|nr:MAG: N-acetyltransferase family protein [Actinomyces sp.]